MNDETLVDVLPFVVALTSLVVTGGLGYVNYRLSRDISDLDREKFAHDKAMVFWDKKVEAYSNVWSKVTDAFEEYVALGSIAENPGEGLRQWVVIKRVREKAPESDPTYLDLTQKVRDDPAGWLPWLLSERAVQFPTLETEVHASYFYLSPKHRALIAQLFDACNNIRTFETVEEFRATYHTGLSVVQSSYEQLNDEIDETFYPD